MPKATSCASTATTREAPAGGVERDSGAGDAEADDEDVGGLGDVGEADVDATWSWLRGTSRTSARARRRDGETSASRATPSVVDHGVRRQREPVAGEHEERASTTGSPRRIGAVLLALGDQRRPAPRRPSPGCGRAGRAGRGAAPRGRRRRCGGAGRSRAAPARSRRCRGDPVRALGSVRPGPPSAPTACSTTTAPLAGHQVGEQGLGVGPAAVERHPADPGPAGDVGERRTAPADGEDRLARGVEVGVVRGGVRSSGL